MNTQPHPSSHPSSQPSTSAITRDWDMMLRTRDAAVHLTRTAEPDRLMSTSILLDRAPIVEGGQPALRDGLLVLTTVHRDGAFESMAGVVVRQQFTTRTVLIQPRSMSVLDRRAAEFTTDGLARAHEDALTILAERLRDEPGFGARFAVPAA